MRTLKQFIAEEIYNVKEGYNCICESNYEYQDLIHEAFTRLFDVNAIINKIGEHYNLPLSAFKISESPGAAKAFAIDRKSIQPFLSDKWLEDILAAYGYYYTQMKADAIFFEPIFTDNITDKVQGECGGKIYKAVTGETLKKIKGRKGICVDRDKTFYDMKQAMNVSLAVRREMSKKINAMPCYRDNKFDYRRFASCCFYFASPNNRGLSAAVNVVLKQLEIDEADCYVLEIDISEYNVNCYLDTFGGFRLNNPPYYLLYINAFFPDDVITVHTLDEFNKKIGE